MCPVVIEENPSRRPLVQAPDQRDVLGLGTVMGGTFGDVTGDPSGPGSRRPLHEGSHRRGLRRRGDLCPGAGQEHHRPVLLEGPGEKALAKLILPIAMKKHAAIEPSMLQDLKKGKPCEVDAINGIVCDAGRKARGIPTPSTTGFPPSSGKFRTESGSPEGKT